MNKQVKSALAVATVAISMIFGGLSSAHAMVQPEGAFVPSYCGHQSFTANSSKYDVREVCVGSITAATGEANIPAIGFSLSDGTQRIYRIVKTANLLIALNSGDTKSIFYLESQDGHKATMRVLRNPNGAIANVSGTLGEAAYIVKDFQAVYVIQGQVF